MTITKFSPDRQPRRVGDPMDAAMTVWAVLLALIDWITGNYVNQFKSGLATVVATQTQLVVVHGLGSVAYRVSLTPNGADPGLRYWIDSKTATQFRINLSGVAPVGGVSFDWTVKGE